MSNLNEIADKIAEAKQQRSDAIKALDEEYFNLLGLLNQEEDEIKARQSAVNMAWEERRDVITRQFDEAIGEAVNT